MFSYMRFSALVGLAFFVATEAWVAQAPNLVRARLSQAYRSVGSSPVNKYRRSLLTRGTSTVKQSFQETRAPTESLNLNATIHSESENIPAALGHFTETDPDERKQKIINGVLLAVSFGYAAFTILNIDSGMTRGWTQSEIAMRVPLDNWLGYEASLAEKPIYTKTLINVVIYLLGDWLSQTLFQGKNALDFDASRTLKNGFIGLCFGPLVHEYYQFSDHILPVDGPNSLMNRIEKIFMDQTIYLTVKASIYVAAVSLLAGEPWDMAQKNVKDRIGGIVGTAWKFWPLVHCITYGLIPARHRILWVNCVDLVWNAILASMSRSTLPEEAPPEGTVNALLESGEHETEPIVLSQELVLDEGPFEGTHNDTLVTTSEIEDMAPMGNNSTLSFAT